jgi:hypothetical protein
MPEIRKPLVEAYWLGYVPSTDGNPPGAGLGLADVGTQTPVDVVKIAFYNLYPSNMTSMCFGMSQGHGWTYTKPAIEALQSRGIRVMASIIGTPNPPVGWNDIPDPVEFAKNAKRLYIDELGCDGIDIDNEDPATPNRRFEEVVLALRGVLGPKGADKALLTYVTYIPSRDLPWLSRVGDRFDWVSTMAYWLDARGQIDLWNQYASLLGPQNVLIGVSTDDGATGKDPAVVTTSAEASAPQTDINTITQIADWITGRGPGQTGGMMLWNLSGGPATLAAYAAIRQHLRIWTPPGGVPQPSGSTESQGAPAAQARSPRK